RARAFFDARVLAGDAARRGAALAVDLPEGWLRPLVRASLRDAGTPGFDRPSLLRALERDTLADIRVDLPHLPLPPNESCWPALWPAEAGLRAGIRDVVVSPAGTVLALGEAGLEVLGPDGRPTLVSREPVSHLAVDEGGFHLVGLHDAGPGVMRLTRIDLRTGTVEPWVRAKVTAWARTYRTGRWAVVFEGCLHAMDVADPGWQWLTRSTTLAGRPLGVFAGGGTRIVLGEVDQLVVYDERFVRGGQRPFAPGVAFDLLGSRTLRAESRTASLETVRTSSLEVPGPIVAVRLLDTGAAVAWDTGSGVGVALFTELGAPVEHPRGQEAVLDVPGARTLRMERAPGGALILLDERGRAAVLGANGALTTL
ncbi:MAG: hypothetical protein KC656_11085, partial [Myxococcales bacterium]|nr:hypothetical protein [Myxococcales bacterium]